MATSPANTTYAVQVVELDRADRFAALRDTVASELLSLGLHRTLRVNVTDAPVPAAQPGVVVYLGSPSAASAPTVDRHIATALASGLVVIPVVDDPAAIPAQLPQSLAPINAFTWQGQLAPQRLARLLLEELGIEDKQRQLFISHKRDDGLGAAEQLHDRLSRERFLPFIDRFAITPGAPVQEVIADALEDRAFLLLLETPLAHKSPWVFDELDYALSHTMGTLILQWPNNPTPVPGSAGLPRELLAPDDLLEDDHRYQILTPAALERVVALVEAAHAHGLVRRRRMLVTSIQEAALAAGCRCLPTQSWRLVVQQGAHSTLVGVTPRLPTATDLQYLDDARNQIDPTTSAVLVHSARYLRELRRAHLTWVTGNRDLTLVPENAIGARWNAHGT